MAHPVEEKLRSSILPRLDGRRAILLHRHRRVHTLYAYSHELVLGLAAIGLSHPVVSGLAGLPAQGDDEGGLDAFWGGFGHYPIWLGFVMLVAVFIWVAMRVYVSHNKLVERVPLYNACQRELGGVLADLEEALDQENPMPDLAQLQKKSREIVDRYYQAEHWPWAIAPPNRKRHVDEWTRELCEKFSRRWAPAPATPNIRARPKGGVR